MAHVGQIPINPMSFFGALAHNQIFGSKDGQVVTYVRVNTACIALIGHYFSTGEVWKTSKNDFSNRECPNIGRVRESLQGCKDVCMVKQGCTGFNYNHKTRSCVMRGCSLPVKPPARNHCDDEYAFWLASTTTGSCKYLFLDQTSLRSFGTPS